MNKRCRLLLTAQCPNNCPLCCNKQFDLLKEVPIIDRWNYDEFILTGGEPLYPDGNKIIDFLDHLDIITAYMGTSPKIYLYTSICSVSIWDSIIDRLDGITYTVHTKSNAKELVQLLYTIKDLKNGYEIVFPNIGSIRNKSIWLNLFPEGQKFINEELALTQLTWDDVNSIFKVKPMIWKENCPVPEGEDFRRINNLWRG